MWDRTPKARTALRLGMACQFAGEEGVAGSGLGGFGQVLGGDAADGVDDAAAVQDHPVIGPGVVLAMGEAEFEQGLVEKDAGVVAGEGAAGAVGAFDAGGHADDQEWGVERAEAGDGGR